MDQRKMLEIIETSAWIPKEKSDKERLHVVDNGS
jgi:hypothetical protein